MYVFSYILYIYQIYGNSLFSYILHIYKIYENSLLGTLMVGRSLSCNVLVSWDGGRERTRKDQLWNVEGFRLVVKLKVLLLKKREENGRSVQKDFLWQIETKTKKTSRNVTTLSRYRKGKLTLHDRVTYLHSVK